MVARIPNLCYILGFLLILSSCKHSGSVPSDKEVAIAQKRWSADRNSLHTGMVLFNQHCEHCHELYAPKSYSEDDWEDILPKMGRKSHLSLEETELVRRFILTRREYELVSKK
jgi:hypothetical protein